MFDLIEKLRNKSEKQKKIIAFSVSFLISACIFVVWLTVLLPDFKRKQVEISSNVSSTTPIDTMFNLFSDGFSKVKGQLSEVSDSVSSMVSTSSPYYYKSTTTLENKVENMDKVTEENQ